MNGNLERPSKPLRDRLEFAAQLLIRQAQDTTPRRYDVVISVEAFDRLFRVIEDLPLVGCAHDVETAPGSVYVTLSDWFSQCEWCYQSGAHLAVGRDGLCDLCSELGDEPLVRATGIWGCCTYIVNVCIRCWELWGLGE